LYAEMVRVVVSKYVMNSSLYLLSVKILFVNIKNNRFPAQQ